MKKKVIFVLIDALRSDYISSQDSPFLHRFSQENTYYESVVQSRSFCERAEIFTGLSPRESGYFTAIGFDPVNSPYRNLTFGGYFAYLDSLLIKKSFYRKVRNKVLRFLVRNNRVKMSSYSIPLDFLKFFSLTEDGFDFRDNDAFEGRRNLFKDCAQNNVRLFYESFTALNFTNAHTDEERIKLVESSFGSDYDLYMTYIGVMDSCAHRHGPDSAERKDALRKLDKRLEIFYKRISLKDPNASFIFLGDHGMCPVHGNIDVGQILNEKALANGFTRGKDFIYFLDSTMFRVWFLNDLTSTELSRLLKSDLDLLEKGTFVDDRLARKEKIPFPDDRYGDLLWLADTGVLIYPDFFHTVKPYKGMHGYDINLASSKGTCLVSSSTPHFYDEMMLTDTYRIIKGELGID